jgi:hypothetical protein
VQVDFYVIYNDGSPTLIGSDIDSGDGWSVDYTPTLDGDYQFYSVATDDDGNVEWEPIYADAQISIGSGAVNVPIPWIALLGLVGLFVTTVSLSRSQFVKI